MQLHLYAVAQEEAELALVGAPLLVSDQPEHVWGCARAPFDNFIFLTRYL